MKFRKSQLSNLSDIISQIQLEATACLAHVYDGGRFSLLAFPDHANVGDSAIWLGECEYFRQQGGERQLFGSLTEGVGHDIDVVRAGTIFLHGGGNFGTNWPKHQEFRIALLNRLRGVPIVQLPQSIHFDSAQELEHTAAAIDHHGAFTLLVRDHSSYEIAREHFNCRTILCPDMSFFIGPIAKNQPRTDILRLLRTDKEQRSLGERVSRSGVETMDWLTERRSAVRAVRAASYLRYGLSPNRLAHEYDALAVKCFKRGVDILSRGKVVVTDRLHGHIMCVLLGIPHVILDNSYGKVGNFVDAWTRDFSDMRRTDNLANAMALAEQLVGSLGAAKR